MIFSRFNRPFNYKIFIDLCAIARDRNHKKRKGSKNVFQIIHLEKLKSIIFQTPKYSVISNRNGECLENSETAKQYLVEQITNPVRWDLCLNTIHQMKIKAILELAPGGILTGIAKKEFREIDTFAIKNQDDIELAIKFIQDHECNLS